MDESVLQADHRIPYEIGGEQDTNNLDCFMLLSPSANRAKSWTCEHCENWSAKDQSVCARCFWAFPEDYDHVAGQAVKTVSILFSGDETEDYYRLVKLSGAEPLQATIKKILRDYLK